MKSSQASARTMLLVAVFLVVSAACLATPTPAASTPTPECTPAPSLFDLSSGVYEEYARGAVPTAQAALNVLANQVERWSDVQDVQTTLGVYRIAVTLISPDVYRAVLINEALRLSMGGATIRDLLDRHDTEQADRDNLRFLITVSYVKHPLAPMAPSSEVALQADQLVLFDKNDDALLPVFVDGAFKSRLNVAKGPYSGFVTYALALHSCQPRIIIARGSSVTLRLDKVQIGEKEFTDLRWSIPLASILDMSRPTLTPLANPQPGLQIFGTPAAPAKAPPAPSAATNGAPDAAYWSELSRYVWSQLAAR